MVRLAVGHRKRSALALAIEIRAKRSAQTKGPVRNEPQMTASRFPVFDFKIYWLSLHVPGDGIQSAHNLVRFFMAGVRRKDQHSVFDWLFHHGSSQPAHFAKKTDNGRAP